MGPATTAFRELRMSRGSLLARNIDREQLRGLVNEAVQTGGGSFTPPREVQGRLDVLSAARSAIAPGTGDLTLAMLSPRGQNLLGMIGLLTVFTFDSALTIMVGSSVGSACQVLPADAQ